MTLNLGKNTKTQANLKLNLNALTKHVAIVGMTGSGKTGLILGMAEDLIENNIPVLMVDIKGDLVNVALKSELKDKMNLRIFTPGASHGESVNLFANMQEPANFTSAVSTILRMIKEKDTDALAPKHIFLSKILEHNWKNGKKANLETLIDDILEPPFVSLGKMEVDSVVPNRTRQALAAKINNLLAAPGFQEWYSGSDLECNDVFQIRTDGKTNVTIYSVAHLVNEEQRTMSLSFVFEQVLAWMRKQQGAETLKAALVVDECAGLFPPSPANPPTKTPIMTLLKQARAFGLGIMLSTQNPMDMDYKSMSNCGTWMIGRLQMKNDRERVLDALTSSQAYARSVVSERINRLLPRQFLIACQGKCEDFNTRDIRCHAKGPLHPREIVELLKEYAAVDMFDVEVDV